MSVRGVKENPSKKERKKTENELKNYKKKLQNHKSFFFASSFLSKPFFFKLPLSGLWVGKRASFKFQKQTRFKIDCLRAFLKTFP